MRSNMLRPLPEVKFDPLNKDHVEAILSLIIRGQQHPTLRFTVEFPFESPLEQAKHLIIVHYASVLLGVTINDEEFINNARDAARISAGSEGGSFISKPRPVSNVVSADFSRPTPSLQG